MKAFERKLIEKISPGSKIVDLGCGEGLLGKLAVKNGLKYVGVDFSKVALKKASENLEKISPGSVLLVESKIGSLKNSKLESGVQMVVMRFVLSHLKNKGEVLEWAFNLLKPGGQLYILIPVRENRGNHSVPFKRISTNRQTIEQILGKYKIETIYHEHYPKRQASLDGYLITK